MANDPVTERMIGFVAEIGIPVRYDALPEDTFLPGLDIRHGALVIDPDRLLYPADVLHEAGHIAVNAPETRAAPTLAPTDAEEMAALAWPYAAAVHLGVDPEVVFHLHGYKGGGDAILAALQRGGVGVPMLAWFGMTAEAHRAAELNRAAFPHMSRWLR